ncbi:hypothetical protein [Nocardia acididurans]|uniref:hypothetical protein n=1 Tax=Nocardia acididurans TaxID=2802282 RepID=UPI001E4DB3C0|nr:hypothetical protein [Nocardia acididurans]
MSALGNASSRTLPALTNYRNILFDTMVHAQDMAIPLGRTISVTPRPRRRVRTAP